MLIGTGTTITFNTSAIAEILDVTPPGMSRESIQSSHMGTTTAHTFLPSKLYDGGELQLDLAFDPKYAIPFNGVVAACVITFPDSSATKWTFDAFITGYEPTDPLEDRMTASLTLKVTGTVTIS